MQHKSSKLMLLLSWVCAYNLILSINQWGNVMLTKTKQENVIISPPNFGIVELILTGTAPLVIERFSKKAELMDKMAQGSQANSKKIRKARDYDKECEEARYRHKDGWEGLNAASFRAGIISACRLVGFKMTIAKLSVFILADGLDAIDGLPLIRIYGKSHTFTAHARNSKGGTDIRSRPMYREWACKLRVKFDQEQFSATDVINLLSRVGIQVGLGAGRPDSKASAGCGWGTFSIVSNQDEVVIRRKFKIK